MLSNILPILYLIFSILLFILVYRLFSVFRTPTLGEKKLRTASLITGGLIGLISAGTFVVDFFQGNYLAPFGVVLISPAIAVIGAIISMILVLFLYVLPAQIQRKHVAVPGISVNTAANKGVKILPLIIPILVIGLVIFRTEQLAARYGTVLGDTGPLTEDEIRAAYSDLVFHHHGGLIRGLLFRDNVPTDILLDILSRNIGVMVSNAAFMHPNMHCSKLEAFFSNSQNKAGDPKSFEMYEKICK
jgi:hypothetical protein